MVKLDDKGLTSFQMILYQSRTSSQVSDQTKSHTVRWYDYPYGVYCIIAFGKGFYIEILDGDGLSGVNGYWFCDIP